MEDPNKDLKEGEEETPSGEDQPDKKTTDPDESDEDESEEDNSDDSKDDSNGEVKVSKSELEQLRKEADDGKNYRKAFLNSIKSKGRNLPGSEPVKKARVGSDDDLFGETPKEEYVTKKELTERDEKRAINEACKSEEVLLNWDDIIVFYQRPKENSYETQLVAIDSAYRLWRTSKGISDKPNEKKEEKKEANKAKQELASEKGLSKGKDKKPTPSKKSVIPHKEKMDDWYK